MKIAVDIRHLTRPQPSGVGEYTKQLLRALFGLDRENAYVLFSASTDSGRQNVPAFDAPNVRWKHCATPSRLLNARMRFFRRPHLERLVGEPADVFFFPNLNFIHLNPGTPYVLTLHDLSYEIFPHFFSRKSRLWHRAVEPRRLAAEAARIIVPSESTARDVEMIYDVDPGRLRVIPHGIDPAFGPRQAPTDHGVRSRCKLPQRFVLFLGTLEPRKNMGTLIEGLEHYRLRTGDDLHLVLAGREERRMDVPSYVHRLSYVPDGYRPALYRAATLTAFPSFYEGFGLPMLESMACGVPVIASATSSMPEVGADAAVYVDPYNPNDIADAFAQILSSASLYQTLRENGLKKAKEYTWEKAAQQTLEVFSSL